MVFEYMSLVLLESVTFSVSHGGFWNCSKRAKGDDRCTQEGDGGAQTND